MENILEKVSFINDKEVDHIVHQMNEKYGVNELLISYYDRTIFVIKK